MKFFIIAFTAMVFACNLHAQAIHAEHNNFLRADSVAALYPHHSLANLKTLADKLTGSLSTE